MRLTDADLQAIKSLVDSSIDERVPKIIALPLEEMETRLMARIDDLDDVLSMQMEHGLQEIRDDISSVKTVVDRIDRVQQTELERNDRQDEAIKLLRNNLHAV